MPKIKPVKVLNAFRPFLVVFSLFNSERFQGNKNEVSLNICKMFGCALVICVIPMTISCGICYSVIRGASFREFALPVSVFLYGTQATFSFLSIIMKNRQITSSLIRVEEVIAERKLNNLFQIKAFFLFNQTNFLLGQKISSKFNANYGGIEKRHALATSILIRGSLLIDASSQMIPAMCPILYKIFGNPQPNKWFLTFGFS